MKVVRFKGIDKEALKICNDFSYYINFDKIIDKEEVVVFQGDNENCRKFINNLKGVKNEEHNINKTKIK